MALFGRSKEKLIRDLNEQIQVIVPEVHPHIRRKEARVFQTEPSHLRIDVEVYKSLLPSLLPTTRVWKPDRSEKWDGANVDLQVNGCRAQFADLELATKQTRTEPPVKSDSARIIGGRATFDLPAAVTRVVDLIDAEEVHVCAVSLDLCSGKTDRFSFTAERSDPRSLYSPRNSEPLGFTKVQQVARPDPPPKLKDTTLADRLRWLLAPPIHEILSDPFLALPHTPYPYQTHGIKWLHDRKHCLLADEMGLGKTMQAIIAARLLWKANLVQHILVVCPKSLIANWQKELQTWWPGISPYVTVIQSQRQWYLRLKSPNVVVKLINYEALQREAFWLSSEKSQHDLVIIDEAQRIKNVASQTAQAVKALKTDRRWALTGTPLENSIDDLVSIFGFVAPGLLKRTDSQHRIRERIGPYMLRRRQEDVLKDLPEMIVDDVAIELGARQLKEYQLAEDEGVIALNEHGDNITITHVFALINKLRQICNFGQVSAESAKAEMLVEELEEIIENDRKALIFGQFVDERYGIKRLAKLLEECRELPGTQVHQLHGEIPPARRAAIVDQFGKDPARQVMLLNYAVGGVGLNLQAANYVFLFDRWWNPAVEDQAIKRCHRLGQNHKVFVKRFYCKNTIEERMLAKLAEKRRLFREVIDEGREAETSGLSEDEIFSLFNLRIRPRHGKQLAAPPKLVLDNIDPKAFENLVAMIYEKEGYEVTVVGQSHDGGVDVVAERQSVGGRDRIAIQCKHQRQNVGRPVLQQLWGVVHSDPRFTRCDVATSSGFSAEAIDFAAGKRIALIDRKKLLEFVTRHGIAEFAKL